MAVNASSRAPLHMENINENIHEKFPKFHKKYPPPQSARPVSPIWAKVDIMGGVCIMGGGVIFKGNCVWEGAVLYIFFMP